MNKYEKAILIQIKKVEKMIDKEPDKGKKLALAREWHNLNQELRAAQYYK